MIQFDHHPQFITITCLNWLPVLKSDMHKQIIIEALKTRVDKQHVTIYAFVLMPNHMHLIWQLHDGIIKEDYQRDFLKFTARSLLNYMRMNDNHLAEQLKVSASDRTFQVWKRNSLSIDLFTGKVFLQKLNYIHNNPVQPKWRLSDLPENYKFSSATFYETGVDEFGIISHYRG
jgi:putative transposase